MLAQTLYIPHFKATQLRRSQAGTNRDKIPIGKDITVRERWSAPMIGSGIRNPVIQEYTAGPQQVPSSFEILRQECFMNVLKHAHTDNFVVWHSGLDVAVIANLHPASLIETGLPDALAGELGLRDTQGDPCRLHTVVRRRVHHERSPTTTYVEQAVSAPKPQLSADVIQLALLGRL